MASESPALKEGDSSSAEPKRGSLCKVSSTTLDSTEGDLNSTICHGPSPSASRRHHGSEPSKKTAKYVSGDTVQFPSKASKTAAPGRTFLHKFFTQDRGIVFNNLVALERYEVLQGQPQIKQRKVAARAYECIQSRDASGLGKILKAGFDPNYHDGFGSTVMHFAAKSGATDCMTLLFTSGSKIKVCDSKGRTPLHAAMWFQDPVEAGVVQKLLQHDPLMLVAADWLDATPVDCVSTVARAGVYRMLETILPSYIGGFKRGLSGCGATTTDV